MKCYLLVRFVLNWVLASFSIYLYCAQLRLAAAQITMHHQLEVLICMAIICAVIIFAFLQKISDWLVFLRAKHWLKRLRKLDGDPLPSTLQQYHWVLENFARWKKMIGKYIEDFDVRLNGQPADEWLPNLGDRYLKQAGLR
ncbi:MAG: hypothetical protein WC831_04965 [Parcubacteria group bacterium]|jgi:hypothetical protein